MSHSTREVGWTPWTEFKLHDVCYGVLPKCGSTALHESIRRTYKLERSKGQHWPDDNPYVRRVAQPSTSKARFVVRHPLDRFESLWRSKCRDGHGKVGGHDIRGLTPEQLFEYIQKHDDPHWRAQAPYVTTLDKEPTLVPLESFSSQFRLDTGIGLWEMNPTIVLPTDQGCSLELLTDVLEHYSNDMILYDRAVRRWELEHETQAN